MHLPSVDVSRSRSANRFEAGARYPVATVTLSVVKPAKEELAVVHLRCPPPLSRPPRSDKHGRRPTQLRRWPRAGTSDEGSLWEGNTEPYANPTSPTRHPLSFRISAYEHGSTAVSSRMSAMYGLPRSIQVDCRMNPDTPCRGVSVHVGTSLPRSGQARRALGLVPPGRGLLRPHPPGAARRGKSREWTSHFRCE